MSPSRRADNRPAAATTIAAGQSLLDTRRIPLNVPGAYLLAADGQDPALLPHLTVRPGKTHRLQPGPTDNDVGSTNWGGGVLDAVIGSPEVGEGSFFDGMTSNWDSQQHVHYVGQNGHVIELYYTNHWIFSDLTALTGAPHATGSSLVGFVTLWNNQQHVDYLGVDGHIHELMFDTSWHTNDLTQLSGGPVVTSPGTLVGFASPWNSQQHVDFIGSDQQIHELVYDTSWHHSSLTVVGGGKPAISGSALTGYVSLWNNQQHVDYEGNDGHVHELVYTTAWSDSDLTKMLGTVGPAAQAATMTGYTTSWNNQQHVVFVGTDANVYEYMYDTAWHPTSLTSQTGAPLATALSSVDGYTTGWNSQQHVNYVATDQHVHELVYDTSWHQNDLTAQTGAPIPTVISPLVGFSSTWNNQQHVDFVGRDFKVYEMLYDTRWRPATSLSAIADIPWTLAQGQWTVPQAGRPHEAQTPGNQGWESSSWVGIDGAPPGATNGPVSNDVLQAGVTQDVDSDGSLDYAAWYEWFTAGDSSPGYVNETDIDLLSGGLVFPGDTVSVTVQYSSRQTGVINFNNVTEGLQFAIELDPPPNATFSGNTAEWIMEDPNGGEPGTAMASFSPVVFTNAFAVDLHGGLGNPVKAIACDVFQGSLQLTTTTLADDKVTVNFIPWDFNDLTSNSLSTATAAAASTITGYTSAWNSQQHVDYISSDNHVHELMYDSSWHDTDLTQQTAAPPAAPGSHLTGYTTSWNIEQHVNYVSADGHVRELMYDTAWHALDLTAQSLSPFTAALNSPLSGYGSTWNNVQHVNYVASNGDVHELAPLFIFWIDTDLTSALGGPSAASGGNTMTSFATPWNAQEHIAFIGTDSDVHDYRLDTAWHVTDLQVQTRAPRAGKAASSIVGFASPWNAQAHIDFIATDQDVHEFVYDTNWTHNNLTTLTLATGGSGAGVPLQSALDGYVTTWNSQQHVNFVDSKKHISEYVYDTAWHDNDLTAVSLDTVNVPTLIQGALTGFASGWNQQQHVDFVRTNGHIEEYIY